jgi:hypothetical protein
MQHQVFLLTKFTKKNKDVELTNNKCINRNVLFITFKFNSLITLLLTLNIIIIIFNIL